MSRSETTLETVQINRDDAQNTDYRDLFQFPALPLDSAYYSELMTTLTQDIQWQEDYIVAFDRRFMIPRKQAWYADSGIHYRYSDNLLSSQPWLPALLQLRKTIEEHTEFSFNAVLATLYRNGDDSVSWHSDDEKELGVDPVIASLSLGAPRSFEFRHRETGEQGNIVLRHGDFLIMPAGFQEQWQHQIPPEPEVRDPRINLTFRLVYSEST